VNNTSFRARWTLLALVGLFAGCARHEDAAPQVSSATASAAQPAAAPAPAGESREVTLEVGGMVCEACVVAIGHELRKVPGVQNVQVSLRDQRANIVCAGAVADTSLTAAVRRAGSQYVGLVIQP